MTMERLLLAAAAVFAVASPYLGIPGWTPSLATVAFLTAVSLIGLNLIFGYCGMLALGQAAFSALSGYGAGILYGIGVPSLIAALAGFLLAVGAARLLAEIFIRLPVSILRSAPSDSPMLWKGSPAHFLRSPAAPPASSSHRHSS